MKIQKNILDQRIESCIKEYKKILIELNYSNIDEEIVDLKNFIDKVAVWYELKFNNATAVNIFKDENLKLHPEFFTSKSDSLYDTHTFINQYLANEKYFLTSPKYPGLIYLDSKRHFHLTNKGKVIEAENFFEEKNGKQEDFGEIFEGIHISNAKDVAEIEGYKFDDTNNIIEKTITKYKIRKKQKDLLLDAIMYTIIKRGGDKIGPRRAMLFAKEFNRDVNIPMKYAISSPIENNKGLIKFFLENGGNRDLEIYINYFCNNYASLQDFMTTNEDMTIDKYIKEYHSNDIDFFKKEELEHYKKDIYQRMVNSIKAREKTLSLKNDTVNK